MPLTGAEIVAELHEPATGAGRGRRRVRLAGGRCRGRRRGVHLAADGGAGTRVALDRRARRPPAPASARPPAAPAAGRSNRRATRRWHPPPRTARTTCWVPRCRPRRDRTTAGTCEPPRPSAGPKMPSDATPSLVWTCATRSPWLPTRSGRPPSRISIALLAGDSAATAALTSPETWAAAMGAPGPATTAVASAADRCFLRLCSRRAFGSSARLRRDRSSERFQNSGVARSRWAFVIHVPFLSGLRG